MGPGLGHPQLRPSVLCGHAHFGAHGLHRILGIAPHSSELVEGPGPKPQAQAQSGAIRGGESWQTPAGHADGRLKRRSPLILP